MEKNLVVLVRCRNEARQLVDFLDMCGSISDGVLLLDDHSTDDSLSIAKSHPAVLHAWKSFQLTKTHIGEGCDYISLLTMAQAYSPKWILILDADERFEIEHFNKNKQKIMESNYNSINVMWPFYDELNNKIVYWGWGPKNNKDQIKIKFKRNIFMKYEDIMPMGLESLHKPYVKNLKAGFCNLVLKHLCVRPVVERVEKWNRRIPIETEGHLGYSKDILLEHIESLKKLPSDHPCYDKWLEGMIREHGTEYNSNNNDFILQDSPNWEMIKSRIPHLVMTFGDKELVC